MESAWRAAPGTDMQVEAACAPLPRRSRESDRVQVYRDGGRGDDGLDHPHGPFTRIKEAHEAVIRWAKANGRRICGPSREVYLQYERDGDPNAYVTEIQYPVTKA